MLREWAAVSARPGSDREGMGMVAAWESSWSQEGAVEIIVVAKTGELRE